MSTLRGYRPQPTSRGEEALALHNVEQAIAAGATSHQVEVGRGTIHVLPDSGRFIFALLNRAGKTVARGCSYGPAALRIERTIAEALHRAPEEGLGTWLKPESVGAAMLMRRNRRTPVSRQGNWIKMNVPGACAYVHPNGIQAYSHAGSWMLLNFGGGAWTTEAAARVVDAMLRDLAPEARHLTYTTDPQGWHLTGNAARNREEGALVFASMVRCSCGWFSPEDNRAAARATAKWHRENPRSHHPA
ncbi:hypothetical protein ACQEU6_08375 [Spirillospora sp. CA-108201]